jgi:hypothetical protein
MQLLLCNKFVLRWRDNLDLELKGQGPEEKGDLVPQIVVCSISPLNTWLRLPRHKLNMNELNGLRSFAISLARSLNLALKHKRASSAVKYPELKWTCIVIAFLKEKWFYDSFITTWKYFYTLTFHSQLESLKLQNATHVCLDLKGFTLKFYTAVCLMWCCKVN